ncbi:SpoIIE family protein phosphatase [Streptomyces fradiae]|uniref:ATP-binding SpoIIE family protein phosphatase n=1 Tax=Streptomyces fradiae TaxID=1906 RepID=UPI0039887AA5
MAGLERLGETFRRAVHAVSTAADARRLAWLNEADSHIGTTLDLQRTAKELADFIVPSLADGAAVDLLESVLLGGGAARPTSARVPLTRAMAVSAIDRLAHLEPDPVGELSTFHPTPKLAHQCLLSGRPILVRRITPAVYETIAPTARAAALLREAGVHSYMVVPLISRGVLLGLADFIRCAGRPPFTPADMALAAQLASKAAVLVDNARLYGRERETVVTLQRALLPKAAPPTLGLEVASSYRPSANPSGVGGDWFDVVPLPGGRTALVVGDVMAHGLEAAATMGRLRTVARTLLSLDISPERVLARLDLAARDLEEDQVATCLCVLYDPALGTYRVASAGHLPPLLIDAAGNAEFMDLAVGAPLGTGVIPYDPVTVEAPEGSRIMMCTDGLIKNRTGDAGTWLERLRAAASGPQPPFADAFDMIWERTGGGEGDTAGAASGGTDGNGNGGASGFGGGFRSGSGSSGNGAGDGRGGDGRFDDAIMLAAAPRSLSEAVIREWSLPADGTAARTARRLVRTQLDDWELSDLTEVMELVVSELVGNALRYGGGPGSLRLLRHGRLCVEVSDSGPDLPQIQHAMLSSEGGRGLQLINTMCRRWGSCRTPTGKVVWAEQDLPATGPSPSGGR